MNVLMALIVALLILSLPTWPSSTAWGYYLSGGLGVVLPVLLVVLLSRVAFNHRRAAATRAAAGFSDVTTASRSTRCHAHASPRRDAHPDRGEDP